jgi:3-oxoacid CoA-transferase A subunit
VVRRLLVKNKIFATPANAVKDIHDGAVIMMHTFSGAGGIAQNLVRALCEQGTKDLTVISCGVGVATGVVRTPGIKPYVTPMSLVENHQVKKIMTTWSIRSMAGGSEFREPTPLERGVADGEIECEVVPQGILAERIRAGAAGLGGILSPIGIGSVIEMDKEKKVIDGKEYILEEPLRADFALIRAFRADKFGNLIYRGTARSYNPVLAMAANVTVVEVPRIVEVGEIDAEHIITPGIFVDRIVEISEGGWK